MAIVDQSSPEAQLRGKVGGYIYARQPDGSVTVRSVGIRTKPPNRGEKKGQYRLRLGQAYVRGVLGDAETNAVYAREAERREMRTCDLVMSDFLKDPVIVGVDVTKYRGMAGDWLLVTTGDDFKVVRVTVVVRNAAGGRILQDAATPVQGNSGRVWIFTAPESLAAGQALTLEVSATDRAGHSAKATVAHAI